ncbi:hypothetical protein [Xenorhabdus bovienii]|uniref:hypothetical protein n=1 Tax=Xenorhabdus bovienii TaxID=40576 RepID=UPI00237D2AE5|nr:hypothetical protein [Xenorhabdus bovienii]
MTDRVIHLNLAGQDETPFITEVECLIGGVPRLMFPNGTDDGEEPEHVFSPRLREDEFEATGRFMTLTW